MEECIFCKIAEGKIPSYKIYEDRDIFAFLDAFPCVRGQVLVIPKKHVGYFIELDDSLYLELMKAVKKISNVIQKAFNPVKVGVIIEGIEVEHVHIKIYPLTRGGFKEIIRCKPKLSSENMAETADKIKNNL